MDLLKDLQWRYATKKYDSSKKVSDEDLQKLLEAIRLTPTSSGLEQFRVIVIADPEKKKQIVPIAWEQQIVEDCSHLLVFASWDKYTDERIDGMLDYTAKERDLPKDRYVDYANRLKEGYIKNQTPDINFVHTAKQAYIGLGFAMVAAANLKIDCTPMEGFSPNDLDSFLGLSKLGLKSVALLPIGYRDEKEDWLVNMKKVRLPEEDFFIYM